MALKLRNCNAVLTGQRVVAAGVAVPGAALRDEDLRAWCAETLSAYKVPSQWELRSDLLPRNAAGKVVKGALSGDREHTPHDD